MLHVDIAVIGAGIAGLSAAWELSAKHRVVLFEQESQPAHHATGRSAAILSETSGLFEVCALAAASRSFFEDPPDGFSQSPLLSARGLLWVSDRTDDLDAIETVAERLGLRHHMIDGPTSTSLVPALRPGWAARALHEPEAMRIDVAALLDGYRRGLSERGGTLMLATPALRLRSSGRSWVVSGAGHDDIHCDVVVNAAGAWADEVATRAGLDPLGIQPFRRTAFVFPVHDHDLSRWPLVMDAGGRFYFEPEADGILASPAEETPVDAHDARADDLAIAMAADALAEATTLVVRGVSARWAGLRSFAADRLPVVGEDPEAPGFFWLAGQGGAGIKTAPALATMISSLIERSAATGDAGIDGGALSPARLRR